MPKVSVFSVFHNRAPFVRATVESLLQQTYDDYEIVLIDDGSTDETLSALRAHEGGRVRVISHPNKGFTHALRDAIDTVDCRYIAIHGSGDTSQPQRLRLQAEALDQQPRMVVVSGGIDVVDPQSGRVLRQRSSPIPSPAARVMLGDNPFSHGETMYRAADYRACGGYRPFFAFAQDRDLFCRLSRRGDFYRVPEKLYARLDAVTGSVSANPAKRIRQILLSAFAVHCHREAMAGRPDPLDAQGPVDVLDMRRSSTASRAILRSALQSLRRRRYASARAYAQFLNGYDPGIRSTALLALCTTLGGSHGSAESEQELYKPPKSAGSIGRLT